MGQNRPRLPRFVLALGCVFVDDLQDRAAMYPIPYACC